MGFINAANSSLEPPSDQLNKKSQEILSKLAQSDLSGNEDFICNEADTAELFYVWQ